ncbi:hypothetical protein Bint_2659 [Brachyspira intermedia PWS/A]|uniref:Lipoprotein n=1 Tax=Brachyspira intermedia (strain ATCC 51140 / PWS/A) TaxID=1045858 RepID=G0EPI8_BRAIP|nr:hypothetical protein [Brachyspira intermedia]AEM23258.1 hypothetical protein Bint_2659 [Brachyspira intermedia PWS/A]
MSKKIFLSLLFVLALAVSCKNNVAEPTITTTITFDILSEQLYTADTSFTISKEAPSIIPITTGKIINSIIYLSPTPIGDNNDAATAITPARLKDGLDKTFASIPNSTINYEVIPPTITTDGKQTITFDIIMTPKNSYDKFDTSTFRKTLYLKEVTEKKIVYGIQYEAYWAAN